MLQNGSTLSHSTATASAETSGATLDAEAILNRFIDVIGGKATIERINSKITESTTVIPEQKLKIKSTTMVKNPDKASLIAEFDLFGSTIRLEGGRNGDVGWQMTPGAFRPSYKLLSGKEKELRFADLAFDTAAVSWRQFFKSIHLTGEEQIADTPCYMVTFKPHDSAYLDVVCAFEKDTFLVKKVVKETLFKDQSGLAEIYLSDYKQVDGILSPHTLKCFAEGEDDTIITVDRIQYNVDIPDSKFELPQKVKALLNKQR